MQKWIFFEIELRQRWCENICDIFSGLQSNIFCTQGLGTAFFFLAWLGVICLYSLVVKYLLSCFPFPVSGKATDILNGYEQMPWSSWYIHFLWEIYCRSDPMGFMSLILYGIGSSWYMLFKASVSTIVLNSHFVECSLIII